MEASQSSSNPTAQQREEEINVCLRINKTVNFKISKNETVGRVKALVRGKEGIPECLQELFFNGNRLENDRRLVDYGIFGNSVLNAYVGNSVHRLSIKLPSEKRTVMVEVRGQDTIKHVKAIIEAKEKIQSDEFSLVYGGKLLEEEDKTLAFLGIRWESTLHVVSNPRDMLQISVKMLSGETVKTQVRILSTVLDVKTVLESKVGYPVEVLAYEGKKLEDSKTLLHYNNEDDSILEMLRPTTHIFIKWRGKSTRFEVYLEDSVKSLKEKIFSKLDVSVDAQKLMFEGKTLNDSRDLASYGVQNDCNIVLSYLKNVTMTKK